MSAHQSGEMALICKTCLAGNVCYREPRSHQQGLGLLDTLRNHILMWSGSGGQLKQEQEMRRADFCNVRKLFQRESVVKMCVNEVDDTCETALWKAVSRHPRTNSVPRILP